MKENDQKWQSVREEVAKAIQMIGEAHMGADLAGARQMLEETSAAIQRNDFHQALSLAQKAQLAAKPNTEYLLGSAKSLENRGSQAYKEGNFAQAIDLWGKALDEYRKAVTMARERREDEVTKALEQTIASIEDDIRTAEKGKANAEMLALVAEANKAADESKAKFEKGEFDPAKAGFESARDLYARSAAIAKANNSEDVSRIEGAEAEMRASIETCLLAKADSMIEAASQEKGVKKEEAFSGATSFLESFSSGADEYQDLKRKASEGLVSGRIEIGTEMVATAEGLLDKREFYQAKEAYRKAQQHFETLRDFAVEHHLEREKARLDNLIDDCIANIRVCTDSMLGREKVATGNIRRVDDLRQGVRWQKKGEPIAEAMQSKLENAYNCPVKFLASGGFGEVWLVQNTSSDPIALKVLRDPERHEEVFFKELQVWQRLMHRNIVRLFRPRYTPAPLFEMEYIDGGDLKNLLGENGRFPVEKACGIAFDIARGLDYAHNSNVIHTDLKPRNILLTKTEEAKISDWGLGKIASSSSKGIGYTPGYAAPEQIGSQKLIDKRTDAYQLGVIFYEMLTGENPFDYGSLAEKDEKVLKFIPKPPSRYNPKATPLDDLIMGCLEKDPANRPGIREFREVVSKCAREHYDMMLRVTGQTNEKMHLLCGFAMMTAKQGNRKECLAALKDLKANVSGTEVKARVQNLIDDMQHREKEGIQIDEGVLNEIDGALRQIKYA